MKTKHKKLLIVTPYFYPQMGGLENYVYNIANILKDKYEWDIIIITSGYRQASIKIEKHDGFVIYRLPTFVKFSNTPINPLWYFHIKRIIADEKPDLINAHTPVPFISDLSACVSKTTPFILTYHAGTMIKGKFVFDLIIKWYETYILPHMALRANAIISSSAFVSNTILNKYRQKTNVIYPGVDTELFKPNPSIPRVPNRLLFICRYKNMHKLKGLYNIIEAIRTLPHVKLRVIGEIDENIHNPQIEFLGLKTGRELINEVQSTSVEILTSLMHTDSYPTVLVEAMSCATPVIGASSGGIPEIITNGINGLIVHPNNILQIRNAISTLLTNKSLSNTLGKNARIKVLKQNTWLSQAKKTNEIFISLISPKI